MTNRFDQTVMDAADRLARDPRTQPMLAAAVRIAHERATAPDHAELIRNSSQPTSASTRSNVEPPRPFS